MDSMEIGDKGNKLIMSLKNLKNRRWVLASRPQGMVSKENFKFEESELKEVKENQMLLKNLYFGFDPTQRGWLNDMKSYMPPVQIGEVMRSSTISQVVESNIPDFKEGDIVQGSFGWQEFAITDGKAGFMNASKIPDNMPQTASLSVYGVTGLTAYFGLLDVGEPKEGDTVVISGAAGATGSVAGQIAKIKGCRVIGIAGGAKKCKWLTEEANFDAAIDYKSANLGDTLRELCPDGIDVVFDNVGGEFLNTVLTLINMNARVVLCGAISTYNDKTPTPGPSTYMSLVIMRARMEGFIVLDYLEKFPEAVRELKNWVQEDKIRYLEDIQEGIENAPDTLIRLFTGQNFGKQLLKIAEPD